MFKGSNVKPNKTTKCQRPLETAVNEARKVFQDQFPTSQIPNTMCILNLFTYFLFDFEWYERISEIVTVFYDILVTTLLATKNYFITLVRQDT